MFTYVFFAFFCCFLSKKFVFLSFSFLSLSLFLFLMKYQILRYPQQCINQSETGIGDKKKLSVELYVNIPITNCEQQWWIGFKFIKSIFGKSFLRKLVCNKWNLIIVSLLHHHKFYKNKFSLFYPKLITVARKRSSFWKNSTKIFVMES